MVDQNNRPKPAMGDIRPRRSMDMGRPSGTAPIPQRPKPQGPAQTKAVQRPQPLPERPQAQPQKVVQRPVVSQQSVVTVPPAQSVTKASKPPKVRKERPFWNGLLQVIVSLLVIVGVAGVIVALYLRYYQ